jgi:hypothetical protein
MNGLTMPPADVATEVERTPSRLDRLTAHPALWLTLAAIVIRLIVFTSRGDYVAFDEGWYLLLGRSLFNGDGYALTGLQHTTLSPLFPILAGAVGAVLGNIVWAGRLVAAVAAGLLVWPCWHIFRRIAGRRVALVACVFIAVMPSLTPFAAPYWIGWDLWVGAEPLLHFFLFSGFALTLRARERMKVVDWVLVGGAFALAYLARPEAIIPFGIAGVAIGIGGLVQRSVRMTALAGVMAVAFAVTAAPYWFYLHDTFGRWALSGRMVELPAARAPATATGGDDVDTQPTTPRAGAAATGIERMLWQNDNKPYVRFLYGLDESGTRLVSTYWGIPADPVRIAPAGSAPTRLPGESPEPALRAAREAGAPAASPEPGTAADATQDQSAGTARTPGRWALYARSLGTVVPWFAWPLMIIGLPRRRRGLRDELLITLPLIVTSLAITRMVGADPRTQLLIVPIAAFYAARGVIRIGDVVDRRARGTGLRPGFAGNVAALVMAIALLSTVFHWVYMGWSMGSPHHATSAASRSVGEALQDIVPAHDPVMSWHPAVALYADRDWRVLPYAPLLDIVRYANAIDARVVVLSAFYPGSQLMKGTERDHLVLHVPPEAPAATGTWHIDLEGGNESYVLGRLRYSAASPGVRDVAGAVASEPQTRPVRR